jgi:hypothetical protein
MNGIFLNDQEQVLSVLAQRVGMSLNDYENTIFDSWIIDNTYQCPECSERVPNGEVCSCKASDRV